MREEEPADEEQQGLRDSEHLGPGGLDRLGEEVEADDTEHQTAGEAEDEVAPVGDTAGDPAAEQRHQERAERDEYGHGALLSDPAATAHIRPCRVPARPGAR
ncbi:hypothetical protein GCM10014713_17350 [Streptomyces purpureus]|uniref:Uncharacterized protein n=1 Tax=Streptomyces purpureus TaxID=1951 RepID=A0A918LN90_9ACTN|nr:hypothetical protein GCM10014713_17350 [Streptomyces purpureus]